MFEKHTPYITWRTSSLLQGLHLCGVELETVYNIFHGSRFTKSFKFPVKFRYERQMEDRLCSVNEVS